MEDRDLMNAIENHCILNRCVSVSYVIVLLFLVINTFAPADPGKLKHGETEKDNGSSTIHSADIDILSNRNPPPSPAVTTSGKTATLFARNYDWKEQDRIVRSIKVLLDRLDSDSWNGLLHSIDDQRYCISVRDEANSRGDLVDNWSIGRVCQNMAFSLALIPVRKATGSLRLSLWERPIELPLIRLDQLWLESIAEKGKSLVECQILLCEEALLNLSDLGDEEGLTDGDKESITTAKARLESALANLKRHQKADTENRPPQFPFRKSLKLFSASDAPSVSSTTNPPEDNDEIGDQEQQDSEDHIYKQNRRDEDERMNRILKELEKKRIDSETHGKP